MHSRPLITFALISFRDEKYIHEAVEAAFCQTYEPLEIILSNDCSQDRTFEIMKGMAGRYQGPHTVVLNRNEKNLGTGGHINRVMELARGELVVIAAGDDVSLPTRTERLVQAYQSTNGRAKSLCSSRIMIDAEGRTWDIYRDAGPADRFLPERLVDAKYILTGSTHAWSRAVFDSFGPLVTPLNCEDMVIPFRSALLGEIVYMDEPLVKYRRHGDNLWPEDGMVKRERFFTLEQVVIYRNWLRDLETYGRIRPGERNRVEHLQARVRTLLDQAEENARLFRSTWPERFRFLVSKLWKGATFRSTRHQLGVFLAPCLYEKINMALWRLFEGKRAAGERGQRG